jgi:signal transduction histidine kinase
LTSGANHRQRLETLGLLAAGVIHDVNNLLTVIANYAGLALEPRQEEPPDETQWQRLIWDIEQIHRAACRGSDLTKRLLAYVGPDARQPAVVSVNDLVVETLSMLKGEMWQRVEVRTELDPGCWPVTTDPVRLGQALVNLAVNARDAMPEGGCLTVRSGNLDSGGRYVRLEVADTGVGIPGDLLDRVFEPFFSTKPVDTGTGLGLTLVRDFARETGGDVLVESSPGLGTRFEILLPADGHNRDEAGRVAVATGFVKTQDTSAAQ